MTSINPTRRLQHYLLRLEEWRKQPRPWALHQNSARTANSATNHDTSALPLSPSFSAQNNNAIKLEYSVFSQCLNNNNKNIIINIINNKAWRKT